MQVDETDLVAYLDLADLQRATGHDELAESTLTEALAFDPQSAEVLHALGLLRVREGDSAAALELLSRAAALRPTNARFTYVYGVALASNGDVPGGIRVLKAALTGHPFDADLLAALATYSRDAGDLRAALGYAGRLADVRPGDAGVAELLRRLRAAGAR
jgi:Flp pilus assembly protein TadD